MADTTSFLELRKQAHNDNVGKWHVAERANWQILDDEFNALAGALITTPSPQSYDNLKGSKSSLEERLDVGINDDGTLDASQLDDQTFYYAEKSHISDTDTIDKRMVEIEQSLMYESVFDKTDNSSLYFGSGKDSAVGGDKGIVSSMHKWISNVSSAPASLSWSSAPSGVDISFSYVNSPYSNIEGKEFKLTRTASDLDQVASKTAPAISESHPLSLAFTNLSYEDAQTFRSAYGGALTFIDCQKTRFDSGGGTATKGTSVFEYTGIGAADVGVNDWQPTTGEILAINDDYYKIKTVSTDSVTIYGKFTEDYTVSDKWTIYDYSQPNIFISIATSDCSDDTFSYVEDSWFNQPHCVTLIHGSVDTDGVGNTTVSSYSHHSDHTIARPNSIRSIWIEGDPWTSAGTIKKTISTSLTRPRIRGVKTWFTTSSSLYIDPMVEYAAGYYAKACSPAIVDSGTGTIDIEVHKLAHYNSSSGDFLTVTAHGPVEEVVTDITKWGVIIDFEVF